MSSLLLSGSGVGAWLPLIVGVDGLKPSVELRSLLGSSHDFLLVSFHLIDFRCLVSNLSVSS